MGQKNNTIKKANFRQSTFKKFVSQEQLLLAIKDFFVQYFKFQKNQTSELFSLIVSI